MIALVLIGYALGLLTCAVKRWVSRRVRSHFVYLPIAELPRAWRVSPRWRKRGVIDV